MGGEGFANLTAPNSDLRSGRNIDGIQPKVETKEGKLQPSVGTKPKRLQLKLETKQGKLQPSVGRLSARLSELSARLSA